jgi:copper chaperone
MEFDIPAMTCGHCVKAVTQTVQSLDPDAKINVELASKKLTLQTTKDRQTVATALTEAGYPTH